MNIDTLVLSVRTRARLLAGGLALGCVFVLTSCSIIPEPSVDPTRYYVLGMVNGADASSVAPKGTLHIGIRAIELPLYLRNNRTIVVRSGANEIRYQDFARWAEPLDLAIQRILRDRLTANDAVRGAEIAPFSTDVQRDFDIVVRVLQCEGGIDAQGRKTAQFSAMYEILDQRNGGKVLARKTFSAPAKTWDGTNYAVLASDISEAAGALGNDIAANLPH